MNRNVGLLLMISGGVIILVGALVWVGALSWFGRLPGDIRYQSGDSRVFIPITSSIIASIILTVVVNVVARLIR